MKKLNLIIAAAGVLTIVIMITCMVACSSPSQKVDNAKDDLKQAKLDLYKAQQDSAADYELFIRESELRISNNEKAILDFKAKMQAENRRLKADEQKRFDELEQKNSNMRAKIAEYKESGKDKWSAFKLEFSHDMDELGTAIKGLTVKHTN